MDERDDALWKSVTETVRPLKGRRLLQSIGTRGEAKPGAASRVPAAPAPVPSPAFKAKDAPGNTLDAGWDKRLRRGAVVPDLVIDLHGFTLAAAYAELEAELARAVARHARLVLLVTGRPPPPGRSRLDNPLRGVIRASIGDWLAHSPHAAHIAAVRKAHPRHGGAGALYLVLRRSRAS